MKKPITQRIGDFLSGRGFYIVLFLCIAAIGISGYYLISVLSSPTGGDVVPAVDQATDVIAPTPTLPLLPEETPAVSPEPAETDQPSPSLSPSPSPSPSASTVAEVPVSVFTWPVKGEVLSGFSLQALCYDETMGDWRTHSGTDIAAARGANVLAMADGTVSAIFEDPWMGTTVKLSHSGGLESVYANLSASPTVAVGDKVDCGQVIGMVGDTALAETGLASHLHLEVWEDGAAQDPLNYLPQ